MAAHVLVKPQKQSLAMNRIVLVSYFKVYILVAELLYLNLVLTNKCVTHNGLGLLLPFPISLHDQ